MLTKPNISDRPHAHAYKAQHIRQTAHAYKAQHIRWLKMPDLSQKPNTQGKLTMHTCLKCPTHPKSLMIMPTYRAVHRSMLTSPNVSGNTCSQTHAHKPNILGNTCSCTNPTYRVIHAHKPNVSGNTCSQTQHIG